MQITAATVNAFRQKTGLPMMECKRALEEANGDEQVALDLVRKKGLMKAAARAGNDASKGRVFIVINGNKGGIAEIRCESEPVTGTDDFIKLGTMCATTAAGMADPQVEAVLDTAVEGRPIRAFHEDVLNRIRENIKLHRVGAATGHLAHYVHHNSLVGVLMELSGDCPADLKADLCMHVAAMRPACLKRDEVDPALVQKEREFAMDEVKGKPANIVDKIVAGKLDRFYAGIVLLEQPFVKDDKRSVTEVLRSVSPTLTINRYLRFEVGAAS